MVIIFLTCSTDKKAKEKAKHTHIVLLPLLCYPYVRKLNYDRFGEEGGIPLLIIWHKL